MNMRSKHFFTECRSYNKETRFKFEINSNVCEAIGPDIISSDILPKKKKPDRKKKKKKKIIKKKKYKKK